MGTQCTIIDRAAARYRWGHDETAPLTLRSAGRFGLCAVKRRGQQPFAARKRPMVAMGSPPIEAFVWPEFGFVTWAVPPTAAV